MRAVHYAVLDEIGNSQIIPHSMLDVGCGNGAFTKVVSARYRGSDITAIDTSISKGQSSGHIRFVQGRVEQLPFDSESFDVVIAVLSLHHWKEKEKGIHEMYRVLKKDGRLIIGDPLLEDWMRNRFLGALVQLADGGVFTDNNRLEEYLSSAGFYNSSIRLIPNTLKSLYLITAKK